MKETIQNVLENAYFQFISIAVILLGVFADALANTLYYYSLGSVVALFILLAIWDVRRMQKIYQKDTLHIPVVINVAAKHNAGHIFNTLVKDIEKKHALSSLEKNLKRYSNIFKDDLIFEYNGDIYNKKSLISFIQIISYQLNKIQANSANKVVFHLAYYKLPSIGFLVGAIFDLDSIVIYQNNPDKDSFDEVAITQERNYKNEVDEYKKFSITEPKNDGTKKRVLLGLKLSSHDIEDLLNVFDGRPSIIEEIQASLPELKTYVSEELRILLEDSNFEYAVQSACKNDSDREALIFERLQACVFHD